MFEVKGRPASNTQWGVWALRFKKGPRVIGDRSAVFQNCLFVPQWKPLKSVGAGMELPKKSTSVRNVAEAKSTSKGRVLDLFSGTGSVIKAFERMGYEVISVDSDPRSKASLVVDIREWEYKGDKRFPKGSFDVIFASHHAASSAGLRRLEYATWSSRTRWCSARWR